MIRTKVIQTPLAPGGHVIAITLFGLVLTRNKARVDKYVLNHELIHCLQQREWLYLPFFIMYVTEWLWYLIKYKDHNKAYRMISFEREAYANERNLNYLSERPIYANYRKRTRKGTRSKSS